MAQMLDEAWGNYEPSFIGRVVSFREVGEMWRDLWWGGPFVRPSWKGAPTQPRPF